LKKGARAVLQFYPETPQQMELITQSAMKVGFSGGLVVDFPHSTKAKKYYLCLFAGIPSSDVKLPAALTSETQDTVKNEPRTHSQPGTRRSERVPLKSKEWVLKKKDSQSKKGKDVRPNSKYTARKRKVYF
jgi:18S rRNA (guanine1575-N7)-methyltransferase